MRLLKHNNASSVGGRFVELLPDMLSTGHGDNSRLAVFRDGSPMLWEKGLGYLVPGRVVIPYRSLYSGE